MAKEASAAERQPGSVQDAVQQLALLNFALDHVQEEAYLSDEHARILYANATACRVLGYSREELLGMRISDIDPDYQLERWPGHWQELKAKSSLVIQSHHKRKDGSVFPVEISINYFEFNGKGYNLGLAREITERKRAEDAIRSSEERFQLAMKGANDGLWDWDLSTDEVYYSPRWKSMLGYSDRELDNTLDTWKRLVHPDDRERTLDVVRSLLDGRCDKFEVEFRMHHKDGSLRHILSRAFLTDTACGGRRLVGTHVDITERKNMEQRLLESESRLRQSQSVAKIGHYVLDVSTGTWSSSESLDAIFGIDAGFTRSIDGWRELVHPDEREEMSEYFALHVLREQNEFNREYRIVRHSDGAVRWVYGLGSLELSSDGIPVRMFGVIQDITGRRQAEEKLRESEERYRQLFEAESDAIFLIDNTSGAILAANDAASDVYGYSAEELLTKKNTDLSAEPSETRRVTEETPSVKGNAVRIPLRYHRKKDGTVFPVEITGRFFEYQDRQVHIAAIRDITERLQAQEALQKSEQMLQMIIDTGPDCIKLTDRESRVIMMNRAGLAMVEAESFEQVKGQFICPLVAPEHRDAFLDLTGKVFAGESGTLEFRMTGLKGRPLWVETFAVPLRNNAGEITALLGVTRDISSRKRVEDEFRRNEARMASLYRISQHPVDDEQAFLDYALHEAIALTGSAIGYLYFYDEVKREFTLNSYSKEVMRECAIADRKTCYELDKTGIWGDAVRQRKAILLNDFEAAHPLKKGYPVGHARLRKFLTVPVIMKGSVVAVVGVANKEEDYGDADVLQLNLLMDSVWKIVQRTRAERALHESEARFRDLAESMPLTVFETDLQGRFTYVNRAALETFGYSQQDVYAGLRIPQVIAPEDRDRAAAMMTQRMEGHLSGYVEYRGLRKDGSTFPITVASGPIIRNGRPAGLRGIVTDMTERKLLEQERIKSEKLEATGMLAGGIAHDFNNLLQGIFGYIALARVNIDDKTQALVMLDQAEKALHFSVRLTTQLLTFAKGGKPVKKPLKLKPVIENSVKFALSGSKTDYRLDIHEGLLSIEADDGQIAQVVQNIVINADQAMPLGGTVTVTARNVLPEEKGRRGPTESAGYVEIAIRDTGVGIPRQYLSNIFDPYFTTKEKGSGIGLATTYSIVKNHGGTIDVESEVGNGTTFYIRLPGIEEGVETAETKKSASSTRRGRILVMDDDELLRTVAGEMIKMLGHEVSCVVDGTAAIDEYRSSIEAGRPYDIVILDITVRGGMGGIEAMKRLLVIEPGIRAIVSSGYSEDSIMSEYRRHGFMACLRKPYRLDELRDVLHSLLSGQET